MNVVIINGSPHKGNSWTIAEIVKEQMIKTANENINFEEVHLLKHDIPMCTGCFNCFTYGENTCPHHEKIQAIAKLIEKSDATIIISPVYSLQLTALTKNFIDHMSYNFHRPRYFTKKALIITTTAGAGDKKSAKYIRDVVKHWGFNRAYMLHFRVKSSGGYQPTQEVIAKCNDVADKFCKDILSGQMHSATLKRLFYYNFWRTMSRAGTPETSYDNYYWKETGLREIPFPYEVPNGPVKRAFGDAIYKLTKKALNR